MNWSNDDLRRLSASPYLYGSDTTSTEHIKIEYQKKNPDLKSNFVLATLDIETDVVHGTNEIILITVAYKNKTFTTLIDWFVDDIIDIQDVLQNSVKKYLGEYITKRNMECEFLVCNSIADMIKACFNKLHEWKPDVLAIWNMAFDIPKILSALDKAHIDPKDVFCDPTVPKNYRFFEWKEGRKKKKTASGKETAIRPAMQWHTIVTGASFVIMDAMCVYKQIRNQEAEEKSYALDAILQKILGIRKLNFKEADHKIKKAWHGLMQSKYKIQYAVYNIFDCVSMLELDETTNDFSIKLSMFSGVMDFNKFNSQPSKLISSYSIHVESKGYILGTVSNKMDSDLDKMTLSIGRREDEFGEIQDGWILILPAQLRIDNGLKCVSEYPDVNTLLSGHVFDLDLTAAYPSGTQACNGVSKETTKKELISITGIQEKIFKFQNINLPLGHVAALEYCNFMFKAPELPELLELYEESKKKTLEVKNEVSSL